MKIKLFSSLIIFMIAISANAQKKFSFDLTGGILYPMFDDLPFDYKASIAPQGSLRAWYGIKDDFSIGVEMHYMQLNHSNESGAYLDSHYLGLPILVKRTFPSNLYVIAGIGYAGSVAFEDFPTRTTVSGVSLPAPVSDITGFVYLPASLGYKFGKTFFLEARSLWGLSKMSATYEYKASPIAISAGLSF